MDLLLSTYHQENVDVDFCWVSIDPEMAEKILEKVESSRILKQKYEDFGYMTFRSGDPLFYSYSNLDDEGFEIEFLDNVAGFGQAELDQKDLAMLESADEAVVDSTRIIVWPDGDVLWHGYCGENHLIESVVVPQERIEGIALEHPKHLLKVIAFAPKD